MNFGLLAAKHQPVQGRQATLTKALADAIGGLPGCKYFLVHPGGSPEDSSTELVGQRAAGVGLKPRQMAEALNSGDIAVIQYECGICDGLDGEGLIEVQRLLRVPSMIVLHTVLSGPTLGERRVLEEVCDRACSLVTVSGAARDRLVVAYGIERSKMVVIPHGASPAADALRPILTRILTRGYAAPHQGSHRTGERWRRFDDVGMKTSRSASWVTNLPESGRSTAARRSPLP